MNLPGGDKIGNYMENTIMLEACHHYINERIFPLLYIISPNSAFVRGTGFLLDAQNSIYLITARHVLEEDNDIEYKNIAFPIFGQYIDMLSLPHVPYFSRLFRLFYG